MPLSKAHTLEVARRRRQDKIIFGGMLIGAILSLVASFVLSIEAVVLAGNPDANLACNVNLILNCATVALHPSAELLGFPNSFLGLMAESVVITVAVSGLSGVKFPRPFMFAAQIGYGLGLVFAWYLFTISFFVIQALCPWCLLVTLTTTLVFFTISRYNIRENNLYLSEKVHARLYDWIEKGYDVVLLASIVVAVVAAITLKYGEAIFI